MVKHCTLCRAPVISGKGVMGKSFHRFPTPLFMRNKWCKILNLDINKLSNWAVICSDHFSPAYYIYRSNGRRVLNDHAVPLPFKSKEQNNQLKSKKLPVNLDNVAIKIECEEQELQNNDLDREIELENDAILQETEKMKSEITIEYNSVKNEPSQELDIRSEEKVESDNEVKDLNEEMYNTSEFDNAVEAQSEDTCGIRVVDNEDESINKQKERSSIDPELIMKFGYSNNTNEDTLLKLFQFIYPKLSTGEVYSCVECPYKDDERTMFRRHFLVHRNIEYIKCPELYVDYKTYCTQCDYVTIQKSTLATHMLKHHSKDGKVVNQFVCNECEYTTKFSCDMEKHRIGHVPSDYKLSCTKCSFKACEQSKIDEHMKNVHIENKKYK